MKIFNYQLNGTKTLASFDNFTFSGGEEHIRFNPLQFQNIHKIEIIERLTNSSKIMRLILVVDALKRLTNNKVEIELVIPYFPYARQDRVCVSGEALGSAVMANLINSLNFSRVTIWDVHSDVSTALIHNVNSIEQIDLLKRCKELSQQLSNGALTLISPDAGASKKTLKISTYFQGEPEVIQAQKVRDMKTGEIIKTEVLGDVKGKSVLITDDICDGGRTFIELAKVLKQLGAKHIALFVTHGIFSNGLEVFNGLIDAIYTTDSLRPADEFNNKTDIKLTVINM